MGITHRVRKLQDWAIKRAGLKWDEILMCELGSQKLFKRPISGKSYYIKVKKVLEHISIDLNGMFGSLIIDLSLPIPKEFLNRFDLITDIGTAEHVEYQYQFFKNIHDMCKVNGIMIHTLPVPNNFRNHCLYYYPKEFFIKLAKLCDYKVLDFKIKNAFKPPLLPSRKTVFFTIIKQNNNEFIDEETFKKLIIIDIKKTPKMFCNYFVKEESIRHLWGLRHYIELRLFTGNRFYHKLFLLAYRIFFKFSYRRIQ